LKIRFDLQLSSAEATRAANSAKEIFSLAPLRRTLLPIRSPSTGQRKNFAASFRSRSRKPLAAFWLA